MKIAKEVQIVLQRLTSHKFEAYVVGGAVRDHLLKIIPSDYDITTNALPAEIMTIFKNYQLIDHGLKHGTVMVIINRKPIEITTYRIDEDYIDHRHPTKVVFTNSLKSDLSRRDFTINSLAYYNEVIDYFNGIEDLNNKLIRAVGDPNIRFNEDALRILRAIRFSCQLNFDIEEKTKQALYMNKDLLNNISVERIVIELNKMLANYVERMLPFFEVFKVFIKELEEDVFLNNIKIIKNSEKKHIVRLALFLNNTNDVDLILKRLRYPINIQKQVSVILKNKDIVIEDNILLFKKILKDIKYEDILNIISFKIANGEDIKYSTLEKAKDECYQLKDLDINGNDLVKLNIPNKQRKIILNDILELVIENKLANRKEDILNYIINHKKENN